MAENNIAVEPLCFTANESQVGISLNLVGSEFLPSPNPYSWSFRSSSDGVTWSPYALGTTITLRKPGDKLFIVAGSGGNATLSVSARTYFQFSILGEVDASGDVMSLLDADTLITTARQYCFCSLFRGCFGLRTAPALSATSVGSFCYAQMFSDCQSLKIAPELPAAEVASRCYASMFYGCSSLNDISIGFTSPFSTLSATLGWTHGVAATGTFHYAPGRTDFSTGEDAIPVGWSLAMISSSLVLTLGRGIASIFYKVNGAESYSKVTESTTVEVGVGSEWFAYAVADPGYSYTGTSASNPATGTAGRDAILFEPVGTARSYSISLDVNGGTGGTRSVTATFGEELPPVETPTRRNSTFVGYFLGDGFRIAYYGESGNGLRRWDVAENATLKAMWDVAKKPMSASLYRKVLKARIRLMSGGMTVRDIQRYCDDIFGEGNVEVSDGLDMSISYSKKAGSSISGELSALYDMGDYWKVYPAGVMENSLPNTRFIAFAGQHAKSSGGTVKTKPNFFSGVDSSGVDWTGVFHPKTRAWAFFDDEMNPVVGYSVAYDSRTGQWTLSSGGKTATQPGVATNVWNDYGLYFPNGSGSGASSGFPDRGIVAVWS